MKPLPGEYRKSLLPGYAQKICRCKLEKYLIKLYSTGYEIYAEQKIMAVKNVAIIGFGLLGASLGMALRGTEYHRLCWARRKEVREWAVAHDAADETDDDIHRILNRADLVIFALPIPQIISYIHTYARNFPSHCIVTDIGSVKGRIMDAAEIAGIRFVGSHPMAGTEKSGCENAFPSLYQNADVFICPGTHSTEDDVEEVKKFWRSIGTKPVEINAEDHDLLVAHTSHVLHVVASGLARAILHGDTPEEKALRFAGCATGFRDTSRIASSSPAMWREIIEYNTPAVLRAMENFETELAAYRKLIADGKYDEFEQAFADGKVLRDAWLEYKSY